MEKFHIYQVLAKTPTAERAYFSGNFFDDSAAGAREQAKQFMRDEDIPFDAKTQFLVARTHA